MIEAVFFDVDGVLTDGSIWVDPEGRESKRLRFDDIDAYFALRRAGLRLGFLTAEDTPFCAYLRRRFAPDFFVAGCADKLAAFQAIAAQERLELDRVAFVGDSAKDIGLLSHLAWSFAPADVTSAVARAAKHRLAAGRGQGVVSEVAGIILKCNGGMEEGQA